jgi:phage baseplate assembly protein W
MSARERTPPSFLGTGWSFPPEFGQGGAEVALVSDVEDVHQSLAILFATRRGERPMQESFGCNLDELQFEEIDQGLVNRIHSMIHDAILAHEPRIQLRDLDVTQDPDDAGVLRIQLEYAVLGTNSRYNMVFPFYLNEAVTPGL